MQVASLEEYGLPGYLVSDEGDVYNEKTGLPVKKHFNNKNYIQVYILGKTCLMHRLVAWAFCYNPDPINKTVVNHIDCCPWNNCADNLEWVTTRENLEWQVHNGSLPELMTNELVHAICRDIESGIGLSELARKYNVSERALFQIKRGANWKHIAKEYNIPEPAKYKPKLTEEDVIFICERNLYDFMGAKEIARRFGYSEDVVAKILSGKNWTFISDDYIWPYNLPTRRMPRNFMKD